MGVSQQQRLEKAKDHLQQILKEAIQYQAPQTATIVYDQQSPLALLLKEAYQSLLPDASFINFDNSTPEQIRKGLLEHQAGDLIILIQSTSFRLDAFRIRVELFNHAFKVIEHPHLGRMEGMEEDYYIDSLAYDPNYYRPVGHALKAKIDQAKGGRVESGGATLYFDSPFEAAKLNIGDYREMKNVGGQFPIGEVFTEAQDLTAVHGKVRIFVFGDREFTVTKAEQPITLIVEKGRIINTIDSTLEFDKVLDKIRADEDEIWLRELGFGMNRAFTAERRVKDIGSYERMCGIHLSLGAKHGLYNKPQFKRMQTWHHVDVFAITEAVYLDQEQVFKEGQWQV